MTNHPNRSKRSGPVIRYAVWGFVYTVEGWSDLRRLFHIEVTEPAAAELGRDGVLALAGSLRRRKGCPTYGDESVESVSQVARDGKVELR